MHVVKQEGYEYEYRMDTEVVKRNIGHTTLHKIVVVYRGMEMVVCEEVL